MPAKLTLRVLPLAVLFLSPSARAADTIVPRNEHHRDELIARARVWSPVDVASRDLLAGPQEGRAFRFGETIPCKFRELDPNDPPGGQTPKFECTDATGDKLKIKYGSQNGEVPAGIAATRLLWALGFGADRNYSVRVECENCPRDPWRYLADKMSGEYETIVERNSDAEALKAYERGNFVFAPALVEKKFKGRIIESTPKQGWKFKELLEFGDVEREERTHREALVLLLSFLQHADSKHEQQRMVCPEAEVVALGGGQTSCKTPILYVHDLGWTFGHGWNPRRGIGSSKMVLEDWKVTPVWKDPEKCLAGVNDTLAGTFVTTKIHEKSRAFLSDLMQRLTRRQIEDLFRAARVDLQAPVATTPQAAQERIAAWADTFESKRQEIAGVRCPR